MANTIIASFDTTTLEGQMKAFNAQNGASQSLKTLEDGFIIEANGVMQHSELVTSYGQEKESIVTTIFAQDGSAYAGVSDTVAKAGEKLIELIKNMNIETFKVKVVRQKSNAGREFLNIQLVG